MQTNDMMQPQTSIIQPTPTPETEDVLNLGDNYTFDGFQVVRREFFAHLREPSATFSDCKFSVNSACINKFPDADAVQVLINQDSRIMALMPCDENAKDSFIWCKISKGKRQPKPITCRLFFAKIVDMMGWNPNYRYKMLGKVIQANGEKLIAFDFNAVETYQRFPVEGRKPRTSRIPIFPSEWQNQFGLPYNEHKQSMKIDIFDGYAVYSIKDAITNSEPSDKQNTKELPDTTTTEPSATERSDTHVRE